MEMKLTGNFIHYGQKNLNGRIYTKECAEKMVADFNMKKQGLADAPKGSTGGVGPDNQWFQCDTMLGQLGYPKESNFTDLANVSHEVEEIHLDEKNRTVAGTIRILETPAGETVKTIIDKIKEGSNTGLYCRPRSIGSVNENDEVEIEQVISFDLVAESDSFANIKENDYIKIKE